MGLSLSIAGCSPQIASISDGSSTLATIDSSDIQAPTPPGSFDDGSNTSSLSETPSLSWTASSDTGGSGVSRYELAIGTTSGGTEILTWTNIGNAIPYTRTGLSLTNGQTYYASLQAVDLAGNTSTVVSGSGFTAYLAPSGLSYSSSSPIYVYNASATAITNNTPTLATGTSTSWSISPDLATSTGLSFNTSTGVISGTPTLTSSATDYTVTATNPSGNTTATVRIRTAPGFVVDSIADTGAAVSNNDNVCVATGGGCTLRAALEEANALGGVTNRVILVPAGTITLGGTQLSISSNLEVIGASQTGTIIDANLLSRAISATAGNFTLSKMTVTRGSVTGTGAAINISVSAASTATLSEITVSNSTATTGRGGGIYLAGNGLATLNLSDCLISGNTSTGSGHGGGGLVVYLGTTATVSRCTFRNNTAPDAGGAGILHVGASLILQESLIQDNSTGVGYGGGLALHDSSVSTLIQNCTFSGNQADRGGAIASSTNTGPVIISNSTIAGNIGTYTGGSTNFGGGIYVGTTPISIRNSILSGNKGQNGGTDNNCFSGSGGITSLGYNISNLAENSETPDANCPFNQTGDLLNSNPNLGPLQDNGGSTHTFAISGAPAQDAGDNANCPATDQRGLPRAGTAGNPCDIGAFETQ